jgi:hypothetical protein
MGLDNFLPILLSWASYQSGYPVPPDLPQVNFVEHSCFVEKACGGSECTVVGWYNDADIVYIDLRYRRSEGGFAASLIVHELTHFLQHKSGAYEALSCDDSVAREREAYYVQNRYLIEALARFDTVRPAPISCNYANAGILTVEQ